MGKEGPRNVGHILVEDEDIECPRVLVEGEECLVTLRAEPDLASGSFRRAGDGINAEIVISYQEDLPRSHTLTRQR